MEKVNKFTVQKILHFRIVWIFETEPETASTTKYLTAWATTNFKFIHIILLWSWYWPLAVVDPKNDIHLNHYDRKSSRVNKLIGKLGKRYYKMPGPWQTRSNVIFNVLFFEAYEAWYKLHCDSDGLNRAMTWIELSMLPHTLLTRNPDSLRICLK